MQETKQVLIQNNEDDYFSSLRRREMRNSATSYNRYPEDTANKNRSCKSDGESNGFIEDGFYSSLQSKEKHKQQKMEEKNSVFKYSDPGSSSWVANGIRTEKQEVRNLYQNDEINELLTQLFSPVLSIQSEPLGATLSKNYSYLIGDTMGEKNVKNDPVLSIQREPLCAAKSRDYFYMNGDTMGIKNGKNYSVISSNNGAFRVAASKNNLYLNHDTMEDENVKNDRVLSTQNEYLGAAMSKNNRYINGALMEDKNTKHDPVLSKQKEPSGAAMSKNNRYPNDDTMEDKILKNDPVLSTHNKPGVATEKSNRYMNDNVMGDKNVKSETYTLFAVIRKPSKITVPEKKKNTEDPLISVNCGVTGHSYRNCKSMSKYANSIKVKAMTPSNLRPIDAPLNEVSVNHLQPVREVTSFDVTSGRRTFKFIMHDFQSIFCGMRVISDVNMDVNQKFKKSEMISPSHRMSPLLLAGNRKRGDYKIGTKSDGRTGFKKGVGNMDGKQEPQNDDMTSFPVEKVRKNNDPMYVALQTSHARKTYRKASVQKYSLNINTPGFGAISAKKTNLNAPCFKTFCYYSSSLLLHKTSHNGVYTSKIQIQKERKMGILFQKRRNTSNDKKNSSLSVRYFF
ncbi:uncharacterized protein LOC130622967 isoform X2 [Hydractinia symbiolongicarpus]|nr:uncharacterized protein LOC130622967 isoform X2 [Hydractinia symbiolongicarpus]XP_057294409.1 uncharacterized protein LOC130622967 isoform X2 [Hydractinia symbiolongicarpus]XP_057294410.1 uncharacterized protein LOC130622967 isoform X2 [Hydractinia symbiolongicarpus]XP_057294411.1 uncharacterized protein LOC130622967 isoform X2 [Hydractinia symbiolongicarpus]XP_057294412.1 uncharacterized protein LOC130622967 isoform X2 [Hydractinia symbiolongicarpus]XP_057294413.1 uncharacterized protein L